MSKNKNYSLNESKILIIFFLFIAFVMLFVYLLIPNNKNLDSYYSNQQYKNYQKLSKKYGATKADALSEKAWNEECKYKKGYETPKCLSEKYDYYLNNPDSI